MNDFWVVLIFTAAGFLSGWKTKQLAVPVGKVLRKITFEDWMRSLHPEISLAWSLHQGRYLSPAAQYLYDCWRTAQEQK